MEPEKVCAEKFIGLWESCHMIKRETPGPNIDQQLCYAFVRIGYQACLADLKAKVSHKGQDASTS
jgi:hypothetical protein